VRAGRRYAGRELWIRFALGALIIGIISLRLGWWWLLVAYLAAWALGVLYLVRRSRIGEPNG
jgi:hypothetical protein